VNIIPKIAINSFTDSSIVESLSIEIDAANPKKKASAKNLLVASTSHLDDSNIWNINNLIVSIAFI
jgi:hypothetical protein